MSHNSRNNFLTPPGRSAFRRYFLADTRLSPPMKQKEACCNTHLSTKIDSKSPGYSSRVVQYSEEQEKSLATHQCKYDRLGIFPIVHFFKKDLPFLKRRASEENAQVNSSELSKFNSPEHNRMLLEKIIMSSPGSQSVTSHKGETNTKSVLDALKEISRKRIHSSGEEFILKEDGKRMHFDYANESNSRKRLKQNTSQMEEFIVVHSPNKTRSLNELMASQSSMDGYVTEKPKKQKCDGSPSIQSKPTKVSVKYVDVETQTTRPQPTATIQSVPVVEKIEKENVNLYNTQQEIKIKKASPIKIFDETPLEAMRRNRLTVLMGSLTPNKVQNKVTDTPKNEDKSGLGKPLVSILSGPTKTPHKSTKHVTFDIPEVVSSTLVVNDADNSVTSNETSNTLKLVSGTDMVTRTSAAITSPIVSASVIESAPLHKSSIGAVNEPSALISPNSSMLSSNQSQLSTPTVIQFNSTLSSSNFIRDSKPATSRMFLDTNSAVNPTSTGSNLNAKSEEKSLANSTKRQEGVCGTENKFAFSKPVEGSLNKPNTTSSSESLSQKGGFKFELKESHISKAATTTTPAPFAFITSLPSGNRTSTTSSVFLQVPSVSIPATKENPPIFNLTSNPSNHGTPVFSDSGIKNFTIPSGGPFSINKTPAIDSTITSPNLLGTSTPLSNIFTQSTTASEANIAASFINKASAPSFITSSASTGKSPLFNFASNSKVTAAGTSSFTSPKLSSVDSTTKSTFGNVSTTSLTFPTKTISSAPQTTSLNFDAQANLMSSPFNKPNSGFVTSNTSVAATFPGNASKTPPTTNAFFFGPPNTSFNKTSSVFSGSSNVSNFGNDGTTKSVFGQNVAPSFGTTTSSFGNNSNQTLSTNTFANVATTASNMFGSTNSFGTSSEPSSFGANAPTNFGSSTFGLNQNSGFGSNLNADPKNNAPPSFAPPSNTAFVISTNASGFNTNATTFSTAPSTFAANGSFGQTNNNAWSSAFGTTSPFDKSVGSTTVEVSPFGTANSTFGSANFPTNSEVPQNKVFTFGNINNTKPPVFSFGTNEPPKPSFNFSTENNSSVFSPNNKGFGSGPPSAFNSLSTTQFNLQQTGAGMFNIGAGGASTPNRSRTQHKAKRRT